MATGRINSPESIRTAAQAVRAFGGWDALERASRLSEDGVRIVRRSEMERARSNRANGAD